MAESQALINIVQKARDTIDNSIITIDPMHHEIHEGNHYTKTIIATKLTTQYLNVHLKKGTAANAKRHAEFEVSANQSGMVYLYEMVKTSGSGGSTSTLLNNNRYSTKASAFRVVVDKTTFTSSTGTLLVSMQYGANQGAQRFGGSVYSRKEWLLRSTKEYLLRYDPAANTTGINITVSWYETT